MFCVSWLEGLLQSKGVFLLPSVNCTCEWLPRREAWKRLLGWMTVDVVKLTSMEGRVENCLRQGWRREAAQRYETEGFICMESETESHGWTWGCNHTDACVVTRPPIPQEVQQNVIDIKTGTTKKSANNSLKPQKHKQQSQTLGQTRNKSPLCVGWSFSIMFFCYGERGYFLLLAHGYSIPQRILLLAQMGYIPAPNHKETSSNQPSPAGSLYFRRLRPIITYSCRYFRRGSTLWKLGISCTDIRPPTYVLCTCDCHSVTPEFPKAIELWCRALCLKVWVGCGRLSNQNLYVQVFLMPVLSSLLPLADEQHLLGSYLAGHDNVSNTQQRHGD